MISLTLILIQVSLWPLMKTMSLSYEDLKGERVAVITCQKVPVLLLVFRMNMALKLSRMMILPICMMTSKLATLLPHLMITLCLAYGVKQGNGLKIVTEKEAGNSYGFAVSKGENAELLQMFNTGLTNLRASGQYQKILDQYLDTGSEEEADTGFFGLLK